jgi:hypothetical protein
MLGNVYLSEERYRQHLQIQDANINDYQGDVGATPADITAIGNDADNAEWLIETCNLADDFKKTAFGIKREFFSASEEEPVGDFVNAPPIVPPATIMAGAVRRSRERDQRFLHAPNITEAARIALDLVGEEPASLIPSEVKPSIEVFPAQTNFVYSVVVSNRGDSDSWVVMVQPKDGNWTNAGTFTGKSADVTYTPATPGDPVMISVRVQLRRKNADYGQLSDVVPITVNP